MDQDLLVSIGDKDADDERLEELALALRAELLATDVDAVRQARAGPAPAGTRAGLDIAMLGTLLVSVKMSAEAVGAVVGTVRSWLARGKSTSHSVKLTIGDRTLELQSASSEQQERLIQEFLRELPAE